MISFPKNGPIHIQHISYTQLVRRILMIIRTMNLRAFDKLSCYYCIQTIVVMHSINNWWIRLFLHSFKESSLGSHFINIFSHRV